MKVGGKVAFVRTVEAYGGAETFFQSFLTLTLGGLNG